MPKSFYIFIHCSQLGSSSSWRVYPIVICIFFRIWLSLLLLERKKEIRKKGIFCQKGAAQLLLLLARCLLRPRVGRQQTARTQHTKQTKTKDVETFHFLFFLFLFSNNPTSLAKASDNVNHPYWFNAFLGFEFFLKKKERIQVGQGL
jgi:hypothetical protein